jgi:chorismate mutase-like protein
MPAGLGGGRLTKKALRASDLGPEVEFLDSVTTRDYKVCEVQVLQLIFFGLPGISRQKMSSKKGSASSHKPESIKNLRNQIDRLDRELLKLVNQRATLAARIGHVKNESGLEVYSPGREDEILTEVLVNNHGPLPENCVRAIFRELMSGSRSLQKVLRVA